MRTGVIFGWHYKVRHLDATCKFIAWCARTTELGKGPLDIDLSETVYFAFGSTADDAVRQIAEDLKRHELHLQRGQDQQRVDDEGRHSPGSAC